MILLDYQRANYLNKALSNCIKSCDCLPVIVLWPNIIMHNAGADLGILVGGGVTLFAIPIIYLQHLFSKFHYQLDSPWGGGLPPDSPRILLCNAQLFM